FRASGSHAPDLARSVPDIAPHRAQIGMPDQATPAPSSLSRILSPRPDRATVTNEKRWCGLGPCLASAARCAGVTYPLWSAKPYSGKDSCKAVMMPSLVTFATMDAAATQAATWSPFQIARDGAG